MSQDYEETALLAPGVETTAQSGVCGPSQPQTHPVLPPEIEFENHAAAQNKRNVDDDLNDEHDTSLASQVLVPELNAPLEAADRQDVPSLSTPSSASPQSSESLIGNPFFNTSEHEPATQYSGETGSVADVEAAELVIPHASDAESGHLEHQPDKSTLPRSPSEGASNRKEISFKQSWRFGAVLCISGASLVLLLNAIIAIVAATRWSRGYGVATLWEGDCISVNRSSTGLHLLINLLGSVLLAASNYTMQLLAAPTRAEVDNAHASGYALDIGTPSIRNVFLLRVSKRRAVAWWLVLITSLPIHLLYNSALVSTTAVITDNHAYLASPAIQENRDANTYRRAITSKTNCSAQGYITSWGCWDTEFSSFCDEMKSKYQDLPEGFMRPKEDEILTWNNTSTFFCPPVYPGEPVYRWPLNASFDPNAPITTWECTTWKPNETSEEDLTTTYNCSDPDRSHKWNGNPILKRLLSHETHVETLTNEECIAVFSQSYIYDRGWVILLTSDVKAWEDIGWIDTWLFRSSDGWMCPGRRCNATTLKELRGHMHEWTVEWYTGRYMIDGCLSARLPQACTLQISPQILLTMIVCNVVKLAVMIWTLCMVTDLPLVTVGVAMASFLASPSNMDGKTGKKETLVPPKAYGTGRWLHALSRAQAVVTFGSWSAVLVCAIGWMTRAAHDELKDKPGTAYTPPFQPQWLPSDYHRIEIPHTNEMSAGWGLLAVVLTVNVPQFVASFLYFGVNSLTTGMLLTRELCQYYLVKRPLRVSNPQGAQKSTYFLTLPYRYSVPVIVASAIVHWLISQGFFHARLVYLYFDDQTMTLRTYYDLPETEAATSYAVYYWPSMLAALVMGIAIMLTTIGVGFQKLPEYMPVIGSNSLDIAAACQRPEDDDQAAYLPISWGELEHRNPDDPCHCCFTSKEVHQPCFVQEWKNSSSRTRKRKLLGGIFERKKAFAGRRENEELEMIDLPGVASEDDVRHRSRTTY